MVAFLLLLLLRVLTAPKYPQYIQYISSILRPPVHRVDKSPGPLFGTKHSQILPRVGVGTNGLRWGQLEYLEHWQYFEILCTTRNSVLTLCCGYILACALGVRYLLMLSIVSVFWAYSVLAIFWPPLLQYLVVGLRFVLERLPVKPSCYPEHQETFILGGYILYSVSYSAGHNVLWRNLYLTQLFFAYLSSRRIHWTDPPSHLFRINIHLPLSYLILL